MAVNEKNFRVKNTITTGAGSNNEITYPLTDGTSGQVLTTDGAGNLSFTDAANGITLTDVRAGFALTGTITIDSSSTPTWDGVNFVYDKWYLSGSELHIKHYNDTIDGIDSSLYGTYDVATLYSKTPALDENISKFTQGFDFKGNRVYTPDHISDADADRRIRIEELSTSGGSTTYALAAPTGHYPALTFRKGYGTGLSACSNQNIIAARDYEWSYYDPRVFVYTNANIDKVLWGNTPDYTPEGFLIVSETEPGESGVQIGEHITDYLGNNVLIIADGKVAIHGTSRTTGTTHKVLVDADTILTSTNLGFSSIRLVDSEYIAVTDVITAGNTDPEVVLFDATTFQEVVRFSVPNKQYSAGPYDTTYMATGSFGHFVSHDSNTNRLYIAHARAYAENVSENDVLTTLGVIHVYDTTTWKKIYTITDFPAESLHVSRNLVLGTVYNGGTYSLQTRKLLDSTYTFDFTASNGIALTDLSVGTPNAASGSGAISYNNTNGVFTYTPPDLSGYLTSYTETDTLSSVTGRGATTGTAISITNTTASSNTTTGALTVSGGVGVGGNLWVGQAVKSRGVEWSDSGDSIIRNYLYSFNTESRLETEKPDFKLLVGNQSGGWFEFNETGTLKIPGNTASSNTTTGALTVAGGVGVDGNVNVGGTLYANTIAKLSGDSITISSPTVFSNTAIIPFYYANTSVFPNATTYHGAMAHSHSDGAMYFAHGGVWNKLANDSQLANASNWDTAYGWGDHSTAGYLTSETNTSLTANSVAQTLTYTDETGTANSIDLSWTIDDTNLARITSGTVDANTGIATFSRDDASSFTVDFSALFDDTNLTRITSGTVTTANSTLTLTRSDATSVDVDVTGLIDIVNDTTPQLGGDLDAQFNNIINVQNLVLEANATSSNTAVFSWNDIDGTVDLAYSNGVALQLGQEQHIYAKASEAISDGDVVMFAGAQGDHLLVKKADLTSAGFKPEYIVGVATQDFALNDFGYVTSFGKVRGLNLDPATYTNGDILYASPTVAGGLTKSVPTYPNKIIQVAAVLSAHQTQGVLMVRPLVMSHVDVYGDFHLYQSTETLTVTVDTKDATHPEYQNGSTSGFKINGTFAPFLHMVPGMTYKFDQSHASNASHPIAFYYDKNKTTSFTTGVANVGTPGSAGAYTQIVVTDATPSTLYYQCANHSLMGWGMNISTHNLTGLDTDDLNEGSTNLYYTTTRFNTDFGNKSTTDLTEGTNLYHTTARARGAISGTGDISYDSATGVISFNNSSGYLTTETYSDANALITAVKTVDGTGSGLDADLLDGQDGSYYLNYTNLTNKPTSILNFSISDGTAGQVLQTDGSGNFSFTTIAGGGGMQAGYAGYEDYYYNVSSNTATFGTSSGLHDKVQVFKNGVYLDDSAWTFNANTGIVTLTNDAVSGDEVAIWGFNSTTLDNHELFDVDASGNVTLPGTVQIGNHRKEGSLTSTIASVSPTNVVMYTSADYVGSKLIITVTDTVTGATQITEALILTANGGTPKITTYGTMHTSNTALASFDVVNVSTNTALEVTMDSANSSTVKVAYTLIDA